MLKITSSTICCLIDRLCSTGSIIEIKMVTAYFKISQFFKSWISESSVLSVKGIRDEIPEEYLSHKDRYENAIRKSILYQRTMDKLHDPNLNEMERAW